MFSNPFWLAKLYKIVLYEHPASHVHEQDFWHTDKASFSEPAAAVSLMSCIGLECSRSADFGKNHSMLLFFSPQIPLFN